MKNLALSVITIALLSACQQETSTTPVTSETLQTSTESKANPSETKQSESQRLNLWFAEKYEQQLQMSPIGLTFLGRKDKYDEIDDMTEAAQLKQLEWQAATVKEMSAKFDYELLDQETKTSYDIWVHQYESAQEGQQYNRNGYVFTQMQGIQSFAAQFLISFHKVDDLSDMEAYIKRIGGVSTAISDLLVQAKQNADFGVRAPKFAYEGVIEQAQNLVTGIPFTEDKEDSPLWADAKSKIEALLTAEKIDQAKAESLKEQAKLALLEKFNPSYQTLISWFKNDIDNTPEIAQGVGSQPNGKAYYNYQLKSSTTTSLTADEIHKIGIAEVDRITNEMIAI